MSPALPERWQGLLLLDKPIGPTSHDIVDAVRGQTGQQKIGHAGTLDPMASGLLPLALGSATRLLRFLPGSPKVYRGTLRLGLRTDTDDVTGEPRDEYAGPLPDADRIVEAAGRLEGRYLQRPPAYSARKVSGRRMYRMARQGQTVEAEPREVEVRGFRLQPTAVPQDWSFEVEVSAGTYVRALARDLGAALGCGAALAALERTRIGPMELARAVPFETGDLEQLREALIPKEHMPLLPPPFLLTDPVACRRFTSGALVQPEGPSPPDSPVSVRDGAGALLGIAEWSEETLRPLVVVARPSTDPPAQG